jgi:hypothetical protein
MGPACEAVDASLNPSGHLNVGSTFGANFLRSCLPLGLPLGIPLGIPLGSWGVRGIVSWIAPTKIVPVSLERRGWLENSRTATMANRWRKNKLYLAKETETETEMGECLQLMGHKSYQLIWGGPNLWSRAMLWKLGNPIVGDCQ